MKRSWAFLKAEAKGFFKAPVTLAKGVAHAVAHPANTAQAAGHAVVSAGTAIKQAIAHSIDTAQGAAKAVNAAVEHFANESTEQQGEAFGEQLFNFAAGEGAAFGIAKGVGAVSKALDFSDLGDAAAQGLREGAEEGVAELTPRFEVSPASEPLAESASRRFRVSLERLGSRMGATKGTRIRGRVLYYQQNQ